MADAANAVPSDFDLTETSVREWVKQAMRDARTIGDGGLTADERKGGVTAGRALRCCRGVPW